MTSTKLLRSRVRWKLSCTVLKTNGVGDNLVEFNVIAATDGKTTQEEKVKIKQYLGEDGMVLSDTTPQALLKVLNQTKADVLIAGAGNKYTALKAQIPFLDINHERHHAYAGYAGLVVLARELHEALYSPIWKQISKPAPWDEKISLWI